MAAVKEGKKWGVIDKAGKYVIAPQDRYTIVEFKGGLASVMISGGATGFITPSGQLHIPPRYVCYGSEFSDDLIPVQELLDFEELKRTGMPNAKAFMWGYLNKDGRLVIDCQFSNAHPFRYGEAVVGIGNNPTLYGVINKQGRFILDPQFEDATIFSPELVRVKKGGKVHLVSKAGETVSKEFDEINSTEWHIDWSQRSLVPFNDGNKWGYLDQHGAVAIEAQFEQAGAFGDGLAPVKGGEATNRQLKRPTDQEPTPGQSTGKTTPPMSSISDNGKSPDIGSSHNETVKPLPSVSGRRLKVNVDTALAIAAATKMPGVIRKNNSSLSSVTCVATEEDIIIEFDVDESQWAPSPMLFPLLVRLFDKNGQYLTHFTTAEGFTVSYEAFEKNDGAYQRGMRAGVPDNERFKCQLLKPKGNRLVYGVNIRDLRDASIVEIGFTTR